MISKFFAVLAFAFLAIPALADESYVLKHNHLVFRPFTAELRGGDERMSLSRGEELQMFRSGSQFTVLGATENLAVIYYKETGERGYSRGLTEGRLVIDREELEAIRHLEKNFPLSPVRDALARAQKEWERAKGYDERQRANEKYYEAENKSMAELQDLLKKINNK